MTYTDDENLEIGHDAIRLFEAVHWLMDLPATERDPHPEEPLPLFEAVLLPELAGRILVMRR